MGIYFLVVPGNDMIIDMLSMWVLPFGVIQKNSHMDNEMSHKFSNPVYYYYHFHTSKELAS